MTAGYEPRFDHDYPYGRQGEFLVDDVMAWLAAGQAQIETKRKRRVDLRLYVECYQNPRRCGTWKPSGINVSTAEYWAYVVADTGCVLFIPRHLLLDAIDHQLGREAQETDGDNPTAGRLIHLGQILALGQAP